MIDKRFRSLSPLNAGYQVVNAAQGTIRAPGYVPKDRVAILGGGGLTREFAPLDDPTWEVWSLNNLWPRDREKRTRADRWFELHPMDVQSADDMGIIRSCPVPLYVLELYPEIQNANAVRFPIERVTAAFPQFDLFPCTFCYQIALAILEGFREIGLFGVDLQEGSPRERAIERPGVLFWLGLAAGRGITVSLPTPTAGEGLLVHPYRYGYRYHEEKAWVDAWVDQLALDAAPWDPSHV